MSKFPFVRINNYQANTIRNLYNTVAIFAMELDFSIKYSSSQITFFLWADGRNLFYSIDNNGYITSVQEKFDNEYFDMENYINLKDYSESNDFISIINNITTN